MTKCGDYIPGDIVADILSNLSASALLRFKTACKTWYSSISDPQFINFHSKPASQNPKKILFSTGFRLVQILDHESSLFGGSCLSCPINFPGETCLNYAKIVGSTCGLVCVMTDFYGDEFSIWNPLTGECRNIVADLSCQVNNYKFSYYFHGFGYDSVANDFKLVISLDGWTYNIFSLKANSWKRNGFKFNVFDFKYGHASMMPSDALATILNGVFYWLVVPDRPYRHLDDVAPFLLAFDVAKETLEKVQLPEQHLPWNKDSGVISLSEHRGSLCVSFSMPGLSHIRNIWMMNEYGVWVHLLSVKNSLLCNLPLLCISTRKEVVFHTGRKFMRCGRIEDKLDEICIQQDVHGAVLYAETLVSPKTGMH